MMISEKAKVYINGRLLGFHEKPLELRRQLINARRNNKIEPQINVAYDAKTNEIYINTDCGRLQRPLIVVENGRPRLKPDHIERIKSGLLTWDDLLKSGIIEYLDADEEENALIAESEEKLTERHTHLELNPITMFSIVTSLIPYLEHDMSGKVLHGAKIFKQSAGLPFSNFNLRFDTESYLLYYPQKPLVKCRTSDLIKLDLRPQEQNFTVAILPFYGFNTMDAVVMNKGSIERGLGRMAYFRVYESTQNSYPGGQKDKFEIPDAEVIGYLGKEHYKVLGEDGLAEVEMFADGKDVIIGKTAPPRFLEEISEFGVVKEKRREASETVRKHKGGYINNVLITEDLGGNMLVKTKVRSTMIPEIGDKFSSKHGQKGVIGAIIPEEDMPCTADGLKPDLILNPHSIPSRMTIGHLLEMFTGKAASLVGRQLDGTPLNNIKRMEIGEILKRFGLRSDGKEIFYDGISGKRIEGKVFTGLVSYRRLYHLVAHKMQARSRGPVQVLTRQPTEGMEKEGGIRFGEMEGETLVAHGASMLLHEKFIEDSDKTTQFVCEKCGVIAINDRIRNRKYCNICNGTKVYLVEISYGFKLLLDELKALGIYPKLHLVDKA